MSEQPISREHVATLLEHRRFLNECRFSGSHERDKTILTIAGGSLAVSVAFMERVVPIVGMSSAFFLATGWICEILAMVLVLWSHTSSEAALNTEIHRLDTMIACGAGADPGWPNQSATKTERLNFFATSATILGLIIMLAHAAVSLYFYGATK